MNQSHYQHFTRLFSTQFTPLGFVLLGCFRPDDCARPPEMKIALPRGNVFALIASAGQEFWQNFEADCDRRAIPINASDPQSNPLDDYTKKILKPLAENSGADYYHPSDRPYLPFQSFCLVLDRLYRAQYNDAHLFVKSPLNILFHRQYGLNYGLRGLLAFPQDFEIPAQDFPSAKTAIIDCNHCESQECISACPAHAVTQQGFSVNDCRQYLADAQDCDSACLAREACPHSPEIYHYPEPQKKYHMAKILTPLR